MFDGFSKVYLEGKDSLDSNNEHNTSLPKIDKKSSVKLEDITSEQKFTQPPSRYTEASLVRELEEKSIGRPSTYAPILSTIQERGYTNVEKRLLHPSELGSIVNNKLNQFFSKIIDLNYTAQMEKNLDEIMEGKH